MACWSGLRMDRFQSSSATASGSTSKGTLCRRFSSIYAFTGEGGLLASLQGPLEIAAAFGGTHFEGNDDAPQYSGAIRYRGFDLVTLEGGVGGGAVQTVRAIADGIRLDTQSLLASFRVSTDDRVTLAYRNGFYTDDNLRDTFRGEYSHRVLPSPDLRFGFEGTFDDAFRRTSSATTRPMM